VTFDHFCKGRALHVFDLRSNESTDTLQVEHTGNVRLNIQTSHALVESMVLFVIGLTSGLIEIDGNRRVRPSFLI